MLMANIVYFVWAPYPKSILKTVGSSLFVFDVITNLLYFAIYGAVIAIAVNSICRPGRRSDKRRILLAAAVSIAVQAVFDLLRMMTENLSGRYYPIPSSLLSALCIFAHVIAVVKVLQLRTVNYKRMILIFVLATAIPMLICTAADINFVAGVSNTAEKYAVAVTDPLTTLKTLDISSEAGKIFGNLTFFYEMRNAALDFAAELAVLIALYFSSAHDNESAASDEEVDGRDKSRFVSRIAAILLLAPFLSALKAFPLPQNFFTTVDRWSTDENPTEPSLVYDESFTSLSRAVTYIERRTVFQRTHGKLYYDNKKLLDVYVDYEATGKNVSIIEVNGIKVEVLSGNQAIAYVKSDGTPYAILLEDVSGQEYDEMLSEICKKLMLDGKTDCFEYVADYVMRFDPDFASPYIERYAKNEFTENERSNMGEISPGYIAKIARGLAEKY